MGSFAWKRTGTRQTLSLPEKQRGLLGRCVFLCYYCSCRSTLFVTHRANLIKLRVPQTVGSQQRSTLYLKNSIWTMWQLPPTPFTIFLSYNTLGRSFCKHVDIAVQRHSRTWVGYKSTNHIVWPCEDWIWMQWKYIKINATITRLRKTDTGESELVFVPASRLIFRIS